MSEPRSFSSSPASSAEKLVEEVRQDRELVEIAIEQRDCPVLERLVARHDLVHFREQLVEVRLLGERVESLPDQLADVFLGETVDRVGERVELPKFLHAPENLQKALAVHSQDSAKELIGIGGQIAQFVRKVDGDVRRHSKVAGAMPPHLHTRPAGRVAGGDDDREPPRDAGRQPYLSEDAQTVPLGECQLTDGERFRPGELVAGRHLRAETKISTVPERHRLARAWRLGDLLRQLDRFEECRNGLRDGIVLRKGFEVGIPSVRAGIDRDRRGQRCEREAASHARRRAPRRDRTRAPCDRG